MEEIIEYVLVFKDNTEMSNTYNGEFISEDKKDTDNLFEQFKNQVEQYYAKTWVRYTNRNADSDWYESDVEIIYDYRDEEV